MKKYTALAMSKSSKLREIKTGNSTDFKFLKTSK